MTGTATSATIGAMELMILQKNNEKYNYPDQNESITSALIANHEPYDGYWQESEQKLIQVMKKHIEEQPSKKQLFLDAGCGHGRMLIEFNDLFYKGIGVDPDSARLQKASRNIAIKNLSKKITFQNTTIEETELNEKADIILCSHVLQHIGTAAVDDILQKFRVLISDQGLLFITTCHSTTTEDSYSKSRYQNGVFSEDWIDKEEFNSLVTNSKSFLPAHFFTKLSLENLLEKAGFEIIDFQVYHILGDVNGLNDTKMRDSFVNENTDRQEKYGRDLFVVARPKT